MMDEELSEAVKKCLKILEENIDIMSNLEFALEDEKENDLVSDLELHNLYDMTEDVAASAKLKRAESNFMRRKSEDFQ
jgi:flagellin-specific chaperone FliS